MDAMSQAERAAVFGFSHDARDLDHEAKELSAKALRLLASLRHLEQEEDARKPNIFDTEFVKELHDEARFAKRVLSGAANNSTYNNRGRGYGNRGYGRGSRPFNKYQHGNFQPRGRGRGTFGTSTTNQHSTNSYVDNNTTSQQ